jgi:hypothetical protein
VNARARRKYGSRGRPPTRKEAQDHEFKVKRRREKTRTKRVARAIARSQG